MTNDQHGYCYIECGGDSWVAKFHRVPVIGEAILLTEKDTSKQRRYIVNDVIWNPRDENHKATIIVMRACEAQKTEGP